MRLKTAAMAALLTVSTLAISSKAIAQRRDYAYPPQSGLKTEKAYKQPAKPVRTKRFRRLYPLDEQNFSVGASAYLCGNGVPCAGAFISRKSRISDNVAFNWGTLIGTALPEQRLSGKIEDNRSPDGQGHVTTRYVQFRLYDLFTLFPVEVGVCRLRKSGYPSLSFLAGGLFNISYSEGKGVDSIAFYSSGKSSFTVSSSIPYQCIKLSIGLMAGAKVKVAQHVAITAFYAREWAAFRDGMEVDDPSARGMLAVGVSYLFTYREENARLLCPRY